MFSEGESIVNTELAGLIPCAFNTSVIPLLNTIFTKKNPKVGTIINNLDLFSNNNTNNTNNTQRIANAIIDVISTDGVASKFCLSHFTKKQLTPNKINDTPATIAAINDDFFIVQFFPFHLIINKY